MGGAVELSLYLTVIGDISGTNIYIVAIHILLVARLAASPATRSASHYQPWPSCGNTVAPFLNFRLLTNVSQFFVNPWG
jgi:hypothetical protein